MKMKRILSLFLSVLMVVCLVPVSSIVADDVSGDTVTNGYYNEKLEWVPGGTGVFTYQDGLLELRKTAKPTADPDIFEITLGVTVTGYETMAVEDNAAAVVVIDTSNSMNSTIKAEKAAAIDFVNSFAGSGTATRYVALVTFDQKASASNMGSRYSTTYWVDVSTRTGLQKAVSAINSISVGMNGDGGTNLDAGLQKATEMLGNKMLSGILDGNKFAVVMTDGISTYYNSSWGVSGSGSGGSQTINNVAAKSATALRKLATVYTICFGVAKDKCYDGGPTVGTFLRDSIATAGTTENKYAYDTYTTTELAAAYQSISDSIQLIVYHDSTGCGLTISDPMGSSVEVYEAPETFHDQGAHYAWVLDEVAPKIREEGNITYYTYEYEITYKIKLKSGEEGFDETVWRRWKALS